MLNLHSLIPFYIRWGFFLFAFLQSTLFSIFVSSPVLDAELRAFFLQLHNIIFIVQFCHTHNFLCELSEMMLELSTRAKMKFHCMQCHAHTMYNQIDAIFSSHSNMFSSYVQCLGVWLEFVFFFLPLFSHTKRILHQFIMHTPNIIYHTP